MIADIDANLLAPYPDLRIGYFVREGELHEKLSLGCQDACHFAQITNQPIKVVVVCDGCSTNDFGFTNNQVGAVLGAYCFGDFLAKILLTYNKDLDSLKFEKALKSTAKRTGRFLVKMLNGLGLKFGSDAWDRFVIDKLLFTILGFVIIRDQYWVFGLGDGCYGINGNIEIIDNSPTPYFGESLLKKNESATPTIQIHKSGKVETLQHLWIASDGLNDLLSLPQGKDDFYNFLEDEFTCKYDSKSKDMTIQAFRRRVIKHNPRRFSDDIAFAVAKV